MGNVPEEIKKLADQRQRFKSAKKYQESDKLRKKIEEKGYTVVDTLQGQKINPKSRSDKHPVKKNSLVAVFGSGEISPTGRKIHEFLIKDLLPPVKIALLETPTGFEENPHHWYEKLAEMLQIGLQNFKPVITMVPALRRDGPNNTNDSGILEPLIWADYIHTGAGSPSYTAEHLKNTLAYRYLLDSVQKNTRISFASATAVAMGKYLLPVYEIYKVGENLHWKQGLDFFAQWGLNLTFIPHWNNSEGGYDIDTSRCYMGEKRFLQLLNILPGPTTILGIDELTACIFDLTKKVVTVIGLGGAVILKGKSLKKINPGTEFSFSQLVD